MFICMGNGQFMWVHGELNRSYPSPRTHPSLFRWASQPCSNSQSVLPRPPPRPYTEHYHKYSSVKLLTGSATPIGTLTTTNVESRHHLDACKALYARGQDQRRRRRFIRYASGSPHAIH